MDAMLEVVETYAPIYFMADQSFVGAGQTQRRPSLHVDGYWHPDLHAHGGGGHRGYGGHYPSGHRGRGGHGGRHMASGWDEVDFSEPEALILASNVSAARAYIGDYDGPIGEGGDCAPRKHVRLSGLSANAGAAELPRRHHPVNAATLRNPPPPNIAAWALLLFILFLLIKG